MSTCHMTSCPMVEYKSICKYIPGLHWYISVYAHIYWWQVSNLWFHAKRRRPVNSHHKLPSYTLSTLYIPGMPIHILSGSLMLSICKLMKVYFVLWRYMRVYARTKHFDKMCITPRFEIRYMRVYARTKHFDKMCITPRFGMHTVRLSRPLDHECWCSDCVCIV